MSVEGSSQPSEPGAGDAIRNNRWRGALAAIGILAVTVGADLFGLGGAAKWMLGLGMGTALAGLAYWPRRRRPWFWPAIAVLVAADVVVSLSVDWPFDANFAGRAWALVILFAAAAGVAWLFWMGWLFDPRAAPRTRSSLIAEVVLYGFAIVVIAIIGFLFWVGEHEAAEEKRLARVVMTEKTQVSARELETCVEPPHDRSTWWRDLPGGGGRRMYVPGSGVGFTVIDEGPDRILQVTTERGWPLRQDEVERIAECLGSSGD